MGSSSSPAIYFGPPGDCRFLPAKTKLAIEAICDAGRIRILNGEQRDRAIAEIIQRCADELLKVYQDCMKPLFKPTDHPWDKYIKPWIWSQPKIATKSVARRVYQILSEYELPVE